MIKVLLVDDDQKTLSAYKRLLHRKLALSTAVSGAQGISILQEEGPFAVVVADFCMPGMDGIDFLQQAKKIAPNTVRMILTGQAEITAVIDAVNEGNIFRFLTKPCPADEFLKALAAGIKQYRLITSERELLERTLKGSINLLSDVLSIVNPVAFSQSSRLRDMVKKVATRAQVKDLWKVELASLLSQIGCVTIPGEILEKRYRGEVLAENESEMFLAHPQVGKKLLANIPRLEEIAEAIAYQLKPYNGQGPPKDNKKGNSIPLLARILKVVFDFDVLIQTGETAPEALRIMAGRKDWYDPYIFSALEAEVASEIESNEGKTGQDFVIRSIDVQGILIGVMLAEDIVDTKGRLLIAKGAQITDVIRARLLNFARLGLVNEPIKIWEQV